MELVPNRLAGKRSGRNLEIALSVLAFFFFFVFTYYGGILSAKATDRSPIMEWPRYLWYGVLPFSGGIIIVYIVRDFWHLIKERF